MENKIIKSILEANKLLRSGHILVILENKTAVCIKEGSYFLMNENWHSKMSEYDFIDAFQDNTFMIWTKEKEETISTQKDEEYYAWRSKYL